MDTTGIHSGHSVVDIGAGESRLVDRLLERGFGDLTALDLSESALGTTRRRLGPAADGLHWLVRDILTWQPSRRYDLWHDRAVFHFLTTSSARAAYLPEGV